MIVLLKIRNGVSAGRVIDVAEGQVLKLGRSDQADFQINGDGHVSNLHCEIEHLPHVVVIRDLESTNGTVINGQKIKTRSLHNDDVVRIGTTQFSVEINTTPATEVALPVNRPDPIRSELILADPIRSEPNPPEPPPVIQENQALETCDPLEPMVGGLKFERGFTFVPGFRLDRFLGRGQFGQVWQVKAPGGHLQAVKFIDLADGQWEKEYRAIQEFKPIHHPHLMPILMDWVLGEDGKVLVETTPGGMMSIEGESVEDSSIQSSDPNFSSNLIWRREIEERVRGKRPRWLAVAMLLGGKNLDQRLQECQTAGEKAIPTDELLTLMEETAKGLDFLNSPPPQHGSTRKPFQHGDVKPANIVIVGNSAVVCDFGVARIMSGDQVNASRVMGTAAYMPPEALNSRPAKHSDQYSLAITYYQLRTGVLPLDCSSVSRAVRAHLAGDLHFTEVSENERRVLKQATALIWQQRYESNRQFVQALRHAVHEAKQSAQLGHRWLEPKRVLAGMAIALILGAAIFGAWQYWPQSEQPQRNVIDHNNLPQTAEQGDANAATAVRSTGTTEASSGTALADRSESFDSLAWQSLLESSLTEPLAAVSQLGVWIKNHPQLATAVPIRLTGLNMQVRDLAWQSAASSRPGIAGKSDQLLAFSDSSGLMAFDLSEIPAQLAAQASSQPSPGTPSSLPLSFALKAIGKPEPVSAWQRSSAGHLAWTSSGRLFLHLNRDTTDNRIDSSITEASTDIGQLNPTQLIGSYTRGHVLMVDTAPSIHLATFKPTAQKIVWDNVSANDRESFPLRAPWRQCEFDIYEEFLVVLEPNGLLSTLVWEECQRSLLNQRTPELKGLSAPKDPIRRFVIHPVSIQGASIIAGTQAGEIILYSLLGDTRAVHRIALDNRSEVTALASFDSPHSPIVMAGDEAGQLWTAALTMPTKSRLLAGHSQRVSDVAISPDGQWAASVSEDGSAVLHQVNTAAEASIRFQQPAAEALTLVQWHPSGRWLVTGGKQGQLYLWDARHLKLLVQK